MTITVGGTAITFNDGTTQTTAGGAPTTAQVLNATAGATSGAVGTYILASRGGLTAGDIAQNSTAAGSILRPSSAVWGLNAYTGGGQTLAIGSALSGTWRAMTPYTYLGGSLNEMFGVALWLRIS